MVCLNKKVPIDIKRMKKEFILELDSIVENELYYMEGIKEKSKVILKSNIIKRMKNQMDMDLFIYKIMDENHCTFKHRNGKNDGNICCKNITKYGNRKKYVCRIHNKDHIPNKKNNSNNIEIEKSIKSRDIRNDENFEKIRKIQKINKFNNNIIDIKNKVEKKKKNEKRIKIINNDLNINKLNKIISSYSECNSEYIICQNNNCFSNKCKFIHINNNLYNNYIYPILA